MVAPNLGAIFISAPAQFYTYIIYILLPLIFGVPCLWLANRPEKKVFSKCFIISSVVKIAQKILKKVLEIFGGIKKKPLLCTRFDKENTYHISKSS